MYIRTWDKTKLNVQIQPYEQEGMWGTALFLTTESKWRILDK